MDQIEVCLYVSGKKEIAVCPRDPEPKDGTFTTWYVGKGESFDAALANARATWEGKE
jgi:hypothetical protein